MKTFTKVLLILLVSFILVMGSNSLYAQEDVKKDVKEKAACKAHAKKAAAGKADCVSAHKTIYACPVKGCKYHSDKPGKCPKCNKELVKKEACCPEAHKTMYVCPVK
ncbi:MAG: hypothetical protein KAT34_03565, partial [Candidatus Aminicenantes bacterium]|nr:hypothetical protein [Candidatus Aminicenantes bacterium]